ncbi:ATP-dependent DNA helicase PcrA [Candidatus Saccharibacteria bacterium 32-50-10]|nr:MAG: ATP-dependent DNA helicase PcrA [Candidatus Saccharibacteria bacterium 32-50-10]
MLEGLNPAQAEAVTTTTGPVLILAGAGSGKTKTLTHRIANLIANEGVWPNRILAVTFTNKAAREMRHRLASLVEADASHRDFMPWMGTFHGICVRLLRIDGHTIGVGRNFVIYDEDDRQALVKQAMKQLSISDRDIKPSQISSAISNAKNKLQTPDDLKGEARYPFQQHLATIYDRYESMRRDAGALDFDDLLLEAVRMLQSSPELAKKWRDHFEHILIDEYQDTNAAQYQLVKILVNQSKNICVVGDDWQSIYSWRGADFTNILNFERDFPGCHVVKLEQNYRSTGNILEAAHNVIQKNDQRSDKKLWTSAGDGSPVTVHGIYDENEEARLVAERISSQVAIGARKYDDFAVLYRTNAQSYTLERLFLQLHIPYQLVGGVRFYDRKEIKDIIAYLRLIYQPNDRMSFSRIANVPTRGIGATSMEKFFDWQSNQGLDIITALEQIAMAGIISGKARQSMGSLAAILRRLQSMAETEAPANIIEAIINDTGYRHYIDDGTPQADERAENLGSLINEAQAYASLDDFLEEVALMSSADTTSDGQKVTLMTLHAAKGLEFPVVFIVGMEEGIIPHSRVFDSPAELEEERRLCYVGMTRAREELHLSYTYSRMQFGQRSYNPTSRFISDMGEGVVSTGPTHLGGFAPQNLPDDEPFYSDEPGFDIGDQVRSSMFGDGEIVDIDGLAVTVRFSSGQSKKLNTQFAHLQKL